MLVGEINYEYSKILKLLEFDAAAKKILVFLNKANMISNDILLKAKRWIHDCSGFLIDQTALSVWQERRPSKMDAVP